MFDNLRRAFVEPVENFQDALGRYSVPEAVDRRLQGMRDETADALADGRRLESEVETTLRKVEKEAKGIETCRRRERMARQIGDEETANVAAEYAVKHETRHQLLERKAKVLNQELEVRRGEVKEMLAAIKQAAKNRDTLAASAGRSQARSSLSGADELFDQLDRMASELERDDAQGKAERDMDNLDFETSTTHDSDFDDLEALDPEAEAEARLEELKRRMGKE